MNDDPTLGEPADIGTIEGTLPVMPLRNSVLFPQQVIPLSVGRKATLSLIKECARTDRPFAVIAQRDGSIENPGPEGLYQVGCAATILKVFDMPSGHKSVVVQGLHRIRSRDFVQTEPYLVANVDAVEVESSEDLKSEALITNLRDLIRRLADLANYVTSEHVSVLLNVNDGGQLADFAAGALNVSVDDRQSVLELIDVEERLERVTYFYNREIEILELGSKIQSKVQGEISRTQREYYLREQLKAIRAELGEIDDDAEDVLELREQVEAAGMPEEVLKVALKELDRLGRIPQVSAEYTVARTYIDWLVDIPWSVTTEDRLDLDEARRVLDSDHYGLEKIKRRIIEYLAVQKLSGNRRAPILCFAGPPGVGKTSLGQSIARAIGRKFVRISLGGVRDEAEIRGHRRTYIGALPGRIVQGVKKAGTMNPLFMLDEIDKLGTDFRGDPSSALLEVLDPEQNHSFSDHYFEVPLDLSRVMFVATANYIENAPPALRDRMEILDLPGYIEEEKLGIAKQFLMPKQLESHGLSRKKLKISAAAMRQIVRSYTREAGVRTLERRIAAICRGVAVKVVEKKMKTAGITVQPDDLADYLGPAKFTFDAGERIRRPGISIGLAWTATGGDILFVEATHMPGKGVLALTGQLGDVMRESAQTALSCLRASASELGIDAEIFRDHDIHVHVPAGAVPKDGPSAGVTLYVALLSLLTRRRVRHDVAMTGEITLRGLILPVGGIKEKVLAAQRAGLKRVVIPAKNEADLSEIPDHVRKRLQFHLASELSDLDALVMERKARSKSKTTRRTKTSSRAARR